MQRSPMEIIHNTCGLTTLKGLETATTDKGGPLFMVRKLGSILVNFSTVEWVHTGMDETTEDPVYTFHFISGKQYKMTANIPLRVEVEKALAEWQGKRFDPTSDHTVSIPAIPTFERPKRF